MGRAAGEGTMRLPGVSRRAYYPSLDGLRAVAVTMVFLQHYGSGQAAVFGWGWTGVDVFFVLSGFLITGILYDSQDRRHRFRDFYARRTLRIFPLYYFLWLLVVLLTPVAAWQWNWRWALWPAYVGNYARFLFLGEPGNPYRFDMLLFGARVNGWFGYPVHLYLGHFWSLCVEEQFYLVWPFVVYRVRRREVLIGICVAVVVLSPVLRGVLCAVVPERFLAMELLYRSLPTRLDALLLGGLVALLLRGKGEAVLRRTRRPVMLLSAALLVGLYLLETRVLGVPFRGSATNWMGVFGFSLIDLLAAALLLECIDPGSRLGEALRWRPLRALGVISYGFYVYHDLLHDFFAEAAHRLTGERSAVTTAVVAYGGTLVIASVSYAGLERPLLRLKDRFASQVHTAPTD